MPRLQDVEAQLNLLGVTDVIRSIEHEHLPALLAQDEAIMAAVAGRYTGSGNSLSAASRRALVGGSGIFVATNHRVIIIKRSMLGALDSEEIFYNSITDVKAQNSLTAASITITTINNVYRMNLVNQKQSKVFTEYVRNGLASSSSPSPNILGSDMITQLERLAKLKEQGVLSDEEFADQKAKLMSLLPMHSAPNVQTTTNQEKSVAKDVAKGVLTAGVSAILLPVLGCLALVIFVNLFLTGSPSAALPYIVVLGGISYVVYAALRSRR